MGRNRLILGAPAQHDGLHVERVHSSLALDVSGVRIGDEQAAFDIRDAGETVAGQAGAINGVDKAIEICRRHPRQAGNKDRVRLRRHAIHQLMVDPIVGNKGEVDTSSFTRRDARFA